MKSIDLHSVWSAPDNSRVTSRQYSFRLPVHAAAKIEALCEMYPTRNRTQIVADLLSAALIQVEQGFPSIKGKRAGEDQASGETIYEDIGPVARFQKLANKHYMAIEKELGNEKPEPLYHSTAYALESDFKEP